jgi:hypothetical protein
MISSTLAYFQNFLRGEIDLEDKNSFFIEVLANLALTH